MALRALQGRWTRPDFIEGTRVNKVIRPQWAPLAIAMVAVALSGCASTSYSRTKQPPVEDSFVSQEMGGTIRSIERSLQVLVDLDRGDEGPRKTNALGMTVAGAAGPNRPPVRMATVAGPDTSLGQARQAEQRALARKDLGTRIRLVWTGRADELLRELSRKIGFTYAVEGAKTSDPVVHLNRKETTVEQALQEIAGQIDTVADVKINTASRKVTLAYRADEPTAPQAQGPAPSSDRGIGTTAAQADPEAAR